MDIHDQCFECGKRAKYALTHKDASQGFLCGSHLDHWLRVASDDEYPILVCVL